MPRPLTLRALAIGAAIGSLTGLATAAHADAAPGGTITYIQGGNVWLTTPDGQVKRQLTKDGATKPWTHPAMAPDGSVFVVQNKEIVHLAPGGETLSRITPARMRGPDGLERDPATPDWLAVSPDGTRLAWGADDWSCGELDPTCKFSSITAIAEVDQPTAVTKYGQGPSVRFPVWVTNQRLLGTENSNSFWAKLWDIGSDPLRWFESYDQMGGVWDFWEPDVTANRRNIAMVALRPNQRGFIVISRSATDLATGTPAIPTPLCGITETNRIDASPTWSPDGLELAYADAKGIQVNTWTKEIEGEADCLTPEPRTIAPAGSKSPDWGAADVLRPKQDPPPPGGGGTPPPDGGGSPPPGGSTPPPGGGTPPPVETPKPCVVPKVKAGASLTSVRAKLGGCTVKVSKQRSKAVKKGRVIKVSRKAGTRPTGTKVTIYVSKGRR